MPEIYLPERIIFKRNIIKDFCPEKCEHAILISDSEILRNHKIPDLIHRKSTMIISHVSVIVNPDVHSLYNQAAETFFSREAELIIAIGSGAAIDCGMLLSYESGARFTAIPCSCASALTDFETADYYSYRHSPDTLVLDPSLTSLLPSCAIAYDALASFAYAVETIKAVDNEIVKSLALHGAVGVYKNIIPAFRGEITALEKLMYSMYFCVASHRNANNIQDSYLNRISRFFAGFGYSKASVCALIIPNIMEYEETELRDGLFEIAVAVGLAQSDEDPSFVSIRMIDEIRKIQASAGIPRAVSGFNLSESAYQSRKIHSDIPDELLDLCYYGSFKFLKM